MGKLGLALFKSIDKVSSMISWASNDYFNYICLILPDTLVSYDLLSGLNANIPNLRKDTIFNHPFISYLQYYAIEDDNILDHLQGLIQKSFVSPISQGKSGYDIVRDFFKEIDNNISSYLSDRPPWLSSPVSYQPNLDIDRNIVNRDVSIYNLASKELRLEFIDTIMRGGINRDKYINLHKLFSDINDNLKLNDLITIDYNLLYSCINNILSPIVSDISQKPDFSSKECVFVCNKGDQPSRDIEKISTEGLLSLLSSLNNQDETYDTLRYRINRELISRNKVNIN
jgi:hypothetical protein